MSLNILRTSTSWWLERADGAVPIHTQATTTAGVIADPSAVAAAGSSDAVPIDPAALDLLSPVTQPCRIVAQMVNYRSHARDSGFDPDSVTPTFFRKASGSITGPTGEIVRPADVRLLDYEVELGLVMAAELPVGTVVTRENLPRYVAGIVVADDVSARDVQLTKGQFYESKSYPTFTPVGPRLTLLEPADFALLEQLRLQLSVNGVPRQDALVTDMICHPVDALTVLARFQALAPGDLLLTGTPGGTALKAPPKVIEKVGALLPAELKWKIFFGRQASNDAYLRAGDVITASIATDDRKLDLGTQRNLVVAPSGAAPSDPS